MQQSAVDGYQRTYKTKHMTPVDAIITHFEAQASYCREVAKHHEPESVEQGYATGMANGWQNAANFLKGLQKLFN